MSDPAWQWCTRVNPNSRLKVKCNFCKQIISGGISRFKNHIAGTHSDVAACQGSMDNPLPPYVRQQCMDLLNAVKASRIEKQLQDAEMGYGDPVDVEEEEDEDVELQPEEELGGRSSSAPRKRRGSSSSAAPARGHGGSRGPRGSGRVPTMRSSNMSTSIRDFFPRYTAAGAQPEIRRAMCSRGVVDAADRNIGRWFYDASVPFNAANSFHFQGIADAIASVGRGYKMPSFHKLRGKILNDVVAEVNGYCDEMRLAWKEQQR